MKRARRILTLALLAVVVIGCDILSFTPLRDNPNDPGATLVAAPVFSPAGDTYAAPQIVTISTPTPGSAIRYTTDGAEPTSSSGSLYVGSVNVDATLRLKAVAYKSGMTDSGVSTADYVIATAPATPQGLSVGSATTSSLTISWSEAEGATSYHLFRDTSDVGSFATEVYDGTALTHTDTGLTANTPYYYKVRAANSYGTSALSAAVSAAITLSGSAPATPTGLAVTGVTATSLTISWSAAIGGTSYQLHRDGNASGTFATNVYDGAELTHTDGALSSDSTYYYKVRATNTNGSSTLSAAISGRTAAAAAGAPATPTGLVVSSPTATSLGISWSASAGATSYQVYRGTSPGGFYATVAHDGTATAFADEPLSTGATYYYEVQASNASGASPRSSVVSGVTTTTLVPLVSVIGGTFEMGAVGVAEPVHNVTVSSFLISKYEVTQAQYLTVIGSNPSSFTGDTSRPVETVNWYDAVAFCNALSVLEGLAACYTINGTTVTVDFTKNGYRLPTEAEWEFAARGGTASLGYTYSGSNDVNAVAWYDSNSGSTTHPVGAKSANELGLYDMSGNVWEFCWDWYDTYSSSTQTDPQGASTGSYRVLRGGSFGSGGDVTEQCTVRGHDFTLGYRHPHYGFRPARRAGIQ